MSGPDLDALFRQAVAAIDAGAVPALARVLAEQPRLVWERLTTPGEWLRSQIGPALQGSFKDPYLLWFVIEDAVRTGRLATNVAAIAHTIVTAATSAGAADLQHQLDSPLKVLVEAGASLTTRDTAEHATPRGWAEYAATSHGADGKQFGEIAAYLKEREELPSPRP
jgi:peptide-methionine (S)-S-oxide reductase